MSAKRGARISRRRFVGLVAAGALAARTGDAAAEAKPTEAKSVVPAETKPAATAPQSPTEKEFERQRSSTLAAVKTLRAFELPPGGDLPVVFRPLRIKRKGR